jgi:outer membrane protein OmpA-like peptidoglycan-associated protein
MTVITAGRLRLTLATVAGAALVACASAPRTSPALDDARATYQKAAADADAVRSAPVELRRAQEAIQKAEAALASGDMSAVEHESYLARQRAATALQSAQIARADRAVTAASGERNRILMDARSTEAQQARLLAEREREQAEKARREAEQQLAAAQAARDRATKLQAQMDEMKARQTNRGMVLTLGDVLFDSGRASLKAGAFATLDRLAQFMRENPQRKLKIEGHTDSVGSDSFNNELSLRRAEAVRIALVQRGVDGGRIETEGLGKSQPVASNDTVEGRQRNRRVEIVITGAG